MGRVFDELAARLATMRRHWAADLGEDWAETVGDELARATRPGGVRDRTVVVYVRNPVWMAEVRRRRRSLLQGLQARYGADRVREVRLELDPGDGPGG
jgi:predicted nucleic acid-binding Zn ribbon protein